MSQLPPKKKTGSSSSSSNSSSSNSSNRSGSSSDRPASGGSKSSGGQPSNRPPAQRAGSKASRPASYQPGGSRPPATRQPINSGGRYSQSQRQVSRSSGYALPSRYILLWIGGVVLMVVVFVGMLLLNNNGSSSSAVAQATPTSQSGTAANGGASAAPQPATGGQSTAAAAPTLPPAPKESLSGPGKYMTIDTAKGQIVCKLYTDPEAGVTKTVANFESKAKAGYFNGLLFHRVEDWVIQGGDPLTKDPSSITKGTAGTGGGNMPSEYNQIDFGAGALGVARGTDPAINNDSQFFITKTASSFLDGQYTNWGQVIKGMDVVTKIAIGDKINSIKVEDLQQAP